MGNDEAVMTVTYPLMPTINPTVSAQDGNNTEVVCMEGGCRLGGILELRCVRV